ncbi:hypothetical protein PVW48_00140 [Dinoroseobacter sp. PD6]|nr:hypothetical protein [Dinoroseobacter sp. PD6]MDD9715143.1 hypothetical protein [Dinoroseobacter sp. PD6]
MTSPAVAAEIIIPANGRELNYATRAVYVGSGGDLSMELLNGDVVTFKNLASGTLLPVRARRVRNSDTTASDLIGLR